MPLSHDYHTHSTYSDGRFLAHMIRGAEEAGLDGVGFADHCNVSARDPQRRHTLRKGFNLDLTYERRREAIEGLRDETDIAVFDAAEIDYDPRDEAEIEAFLDEAAFDYAIGSVHYLEDIDVHTRSYFAEKSDAERRRLVDEYFDKLVALVESELFEIAAHVDLVERNPALRGLATADHYERVAEAFVDSRTVPELNAGRVLRSYGEFHPAPEFVEILLDRGVRFTVGSDSHRPEEIRKRVPEIEAEFAEYELDPVRIVE